MSIRFMAASAVVALLFSVAALADDAKTIPPAEVITKTREARDLVSVGIPSEFVVDGEKKFNSWALAAKRIVFKSGASLAFSDEALSRRNEFFIIAEEIVSEDQANPGKITWSRGSEPASAPPAAGQAPGGAHGQGDGDSGGAGSPGSTGNQGYAGRNAPSLTIFVRKIVGSGQFLDFKGQDAGKGGKGKLAVTEVSDTRDRRQAKRCLSARMELGTEEMAGMAAMVELGEQGVTAEWAAQ